jgi:hypothetical protein
MTLDGQNSKSLSDKIFNYCLALTGSPRVDITEISIRENPFLLPEYQNFLTKFPNFKEGVVHIDPKGHYTPIDEGSFGCATLRRLPFTNQRVIAITDMRNTALFKEDRLAIFFHGVVPTNWGYKFISKNFFIIPIPGISPGSQEILFRTDSAANYFKEEYDDFDEDDRYILAAKQEYETRYETQSDNYSRSTKNTNDDE